MSSINTSATMTVSERFHAVMDFKPVDRMPIIEWAVWWDLTLARWRNEGLDPKWDRYDLYREFGMDVYGQAWFHAVDESVHFPDREGGGLIEDLAGYERLLPDLYAPEGYQDAVWNDLRRFASWKERGEAAIWFTIDGFFWFPRMLLGIEGHLFAFYDQPELIHRINQDHCIWMLQLIDRIDAVCRPDFMTFAEDLSYNNGPMLSRAQFDEFLLPYYRQIVPALRERGIRVFIDTDGNVRDAVPWFEDAGIDGVLPLERRAGVDLPELRRRHPHHCFIGGFDKTCMDKGEAAMRSEFERLLPVAKTGGYIISCDHQTPPEVSLDQYRTYLTLLKEYAHRIGPDNNEGSNS